MSPLRSGWWSQTGSNRRPQACKASALPTELWPRCPTAWFAGLLEVRRTFFSHAFPRGKMVGLGRLELPTSRLSSARSNQLSYRPPGWTNQHPAGNPSPGTRHRSSRLSAVGNRRHRKDPRGGNPIGRDTRTAATPPFVAMVRRPDPFRADYSAWIQVLQGPGTEVPSFLERR